MLGHVPLLWTADSSSSKPQRFIELLFPLKTANLRAVRARAALTNSFASVIKRMTFLTVLFAVGFSFPVLAQPQPTDFHKAYGSRFQRRDVSKLAATGRPVDAVHRWNQVPRASKSPTTSSTTHLSRYTENESGLDRN